MRILVGAALASLPLFFGVAMAGVSGSGHPSAAACPAAETSSADYEIALLKSRVTVPRGAVVEVPVCVARAAGFDGAVRIRAELLPAGVDAAPLLIPAGATSGLLRIAASRRAHAGSPQDAVLVGAAYGRVHTVPLVVSVAGMRDPGPSDPNEDEGQTAVAMLSSAR